MLGTWLMAAIELACNVTISPLSGLWFDAGCGVAFLLVCSLFYCMLGIASLSDQQVAEMGGQR